MSFRRGVPLRLIAIGMAGIAFFIVFLTPVVNSLRVFEGSTKGAP